MNKLKLGGLFFGVLLLGTSPALADFYTYDVNQSIAGGSATGWIETNGIGSITETGQIYDWVLTLSDGSNNEVLLGPQQIGTNSTAFVSGTGLTATATTLTFDFSVTDSSELLFSDPDPTSLEYLSCSGGPPSGCDSAGLYLAVAAPAVYELKTFKEVIGTAPTPLPPALPLFATGLCAMGLLGWCTKRKAPAVAMDPQ